MGMIALRRLRNFDRDFRFVGAIAHMPAKVHERESSDDNDQSTDDEVQGVVRSAIRVFGHLDLPYSFNRGRRVNAQPLRPTPY
jgi:hypothetical protein